MIVHPTIIKLQRIMEQHSSAGKKDWWERYLKKEIAFRGIGIPDIRIVLNGWYKQEEIGQLSLTEQLQIAIDLFHQPLAEDKLAGILMLQIFLYNKVSFKQLIQNFEQLFKDRCIFDWNTCDWFCVRVIGPLIKIHGMPCARAILDWKDSDYLWQARASVVPFVNLLEEKSYHREVLDACKILIRRNERFSKTAVGWLLRELENADHNKVLGFMEQNLKFFSMEVLKNTTKHFDPKSRKQWIGKFKTTQAR